MLKPTTLSLTKPEVIVRFVVTHKRPFNRLRFLIRQICQMRRVGLFLIRDGEQIVRQRQLKDSFPIATIQQIRLPRLLIGDKRRIDRIRHSIRIHVRQRAALGVNQSPVIGPRSTSIRINPIRRRNPNRTVSRPGFANRIIAIEHPVVLDRRRRPRSRAVLFLDHARSVEYSADHRPRPIETGRLEYGEVDATSEKVEVAVKFDDAGVVHGDIALVGRGVFSRIGDDVVRGFDSGGGESPW